MLFTIELHGFQGFRITANSEKVVITLFFISMMAFSQTMAQLFAAASKDIHREQNIKALSTMFDDMMADIERHGRDGLLEDVSNALRAATKEKLEEIVGTLTETASSK